ncbi:hypothetical protein [Rhodoferax fermentans]|nr:hypothetical protein [Rhodoferax fermentans]MBK1685298.1 hypothetical protein [Rhodoferax fermentans]
MSVLRHLPTPVSPPALAHAIRRTLLEVGMFQAPAVKPSHDVHAPCPFASQPQVAWSDELPTALQALVVVPLRFQVFEDYELRAGRVTGCDQHQQPCYCASHFVLTDLRSDDDDVFYEAPVYTESQTAWRLLDGRWLVCHTTVDRIKPGGVHTRYVLSPTMPR